MNWVTAATRCEIGAGKAGGEATRADCIHAIIKIACQAWTLRKVGGVPCGAVAGEAC